MDAVMTAVQTNYVSSAATELAGDPGPMATASDDSAPIIPLGPTAKRRFGLPHIRTQFGLGRLLGRTTLTVAAAALAMTVGFTSPSMAAQDIPGQTHQVVSRNVATTWSGVTINSDTVADSTRFSMVGGEKVYGGQTVVGQGVDAALHQTLLSRIPTLDARGRPTKGRDVFDFMSSGITNRHVTPFSRIISGNGRAREFLPDLSKHEVGRYHVTGLGNNGVWAALGLAPTSGGQGQRNGMTDLEAALMYAAIDDAQRFTVYHPTSSQTSSKHGDVDRNAFESDGLVAGQRPATDPGGEPRVVNPIPLLMKLEPGWNKVVYNPYPIPNVDHPCNAGPCSVEWRGDTYDIPKHRAHTGAVGEYGFPEGRIWLVYWDGR